MQKIIDKIKAIAIKKQFGTIKIICNFSKGFVTKVTIFDGESVDKLSKDELK